MTKYKININRPEITQEEIVQHKDFNVILKKLKREKHHAYKTNWTVIYVLILELLVCVFLAVKIIKEMSSDKGKQRPSIENKQPADKF